MIQLCKCKYRISIIRDLVFFIGKILKLKAVESKIKCVLYIEK